jgi:hypothetical protein
MIALGNGSLRALLLHPEEDRPLLGPRFCAAGYIRQIEDQASGPLLSGPEYPSASPDVVNGQGAPDVFQNTLFDNPNETPDFKLIIGVGLVKNTQRLRQTDSHFSCRVEQFCDWRLTSSNCELVASTEQEYSAFALRLTRSVRVTNNRIESFTKLFNRSGRAPLPFRWFAHPFFPVPCTARFRSSLTIPDGPAFGRTVDGRIVLKQEYPWRNGYFLEATNAAGCRLQAEIEIGEGSSITCETDFELSKLALWANERTFSIEPFYARTLQPGEEAAWTVTYTVHDRGV